MGPCSRGYGPCITPMNVNAETVSGHAARRKSRQIPDRQAGQLRGRLRSPRGFEGRLMGRPRVQAVCTLTRRSDQRGGGHRPRSPEFHCILFVCGRRVFYPPLCFRVPLFSSLLLLYFTFCVWWSRSLRSKAALFSLICFLRSFGPPGRLVRVRGSVGFS